MGWVCISIANVNAMPFPSTILIKTQKELNKRHQSKNRKMFVVLLLAANMALSASMDTSCLGTDADVNDETFLAEHVGNETLQAINDGERAFR